MKGTLIICILLVVLMIVGITTCTPAEYYPQEGEWFCKELGIQLAFDKNGSCFILVNGEKIVCGCGSDKGSDYLSVGCQEDVCPYFELGESVFGAEFVALTEDKLIVKEATTGIQYIFTRVK